MKSADYVVSFKRMKDDGRIKVFSVWVAYLPIRSKCHWYGRPKIKRNKVLYSKAAVDRYSVNGIRPKFFLPTPIGVIGLCGENTNSPNKVSFRVGCYYHFPEEMTLNVGDIHTPGDAYKLHTLQGNGLFDFKVKLTNLFRENQGVFKAGWNLKDGEYHGMRIWDFHMGWNYWSGAYHSKFVPNKNFK